MQKKVVDATVLASAVIGSLVLVNLIGLGLFGRLDLTRNREFTLSKATRDTLKSLTDPVTVRAYFTKDLPPPFSANARYVKDLLEEYYANAHGNLRFEFLDPASQETETDKEKKKELSRDVFGRPVREETSVEKELRGLGITPVQVRVNKGDKVEVERAYMGIVIHYGEKKEVIPVVNGTEGLEYDLTTMIRKVSREKAPKVALIGGHGSPDPQKDMGRFMGLMRQLYDVSTLDLTEKAEIPEDISAILVIAPKTPLGEAEQKAIDKFVVSGRSAAFLLGAVAPDLKSGSTEPLDHGLSGLLEGWGLKLGQGLVLDADCAMITVAQQAGFMQVRQPVRYPFIPLPKSLDPKHPLTRGLSQIAFPFMSPIELAGTSQGGVHLDVLVKSSTASWIQFPPYDINPLQRWTRDVVKEEGEKNLLVALSGNVKSHFADKEDDGSTGSEARAEKARVLVAGGYTFVLDDFLSKPSEALALNLLDWLVQDEALLSVRTRGLVAAPLNDKISDAHRSALKYANIVGLPLAFVGFGLVRWRMREGRRSKVSL